MTELESLRLEVERLRLLKAEKEAQIECLIGVLSRCQSITLEYFYNGIYDSIDEDGSVYQSPELIAALTEGAKLRTDADARSG